MNLLSAGFILFMIAAGTAYWAAPRRARSWVLLIASSVFYAIWDARLLALLLAAAMLNHAIVHSIAGPAAASAARRKTILRAGIVFQCTLLFAFKYFGFFVDSGRAVLQAAGLATAPLTLEIAVPLGLSYFCLKAISIQAEAYLGRLATVPTPLQHAVYLLFFPSLTAGPIDRPQPFLAQMEPAARPPLLPSLQRGGDLLFAGIIKKLVVANHLAVAVDRAFAGDFTSTGAAALAAVTYAVFIYADFSGYTDIARGFAACLGFDLAINFRTPYASHSPSEFWQRWHMSLSSWLRDYVFLPLGGAFRSRGRAYLNLVITMLVAGLWHGASWMFVLWGLYFGLLLVGHRSLQPPLKRLRRRLHLRGRLRRSVEVALTFVLVSAGWLIFRADSPGQLASVLNRDLFAGAADWRAFAATVLPFAALLLLVDGLAGAGQDPRLLRGSRLPWWSKPVLVALTVYAVFILGVRTQSFVYAQF